MRVYIATSLRNAARFLQVRDALTARGHELTYDWHAGGPVPPNPEDQAQRTREDLDGVAAAEALVMLLPGGRGTHVELGFTLGLSRSGPRRALRWLRVSASSWVLPPPGGSIPSANVPW